MSSLELRMAFGLENVPNKELNILWFIKNFDELPSGIGEITESPEYKTDDTDVIATLLLYPGGKYACSSEYITIGFKLKSQTAAALIGDYWICAPKTHEGSCAHSSLGLIDFTNQAVYNETFLKRDAVGKILNNGCLKIACHISLNGNLLYKGYYINTPYNPIPDHPIDINDSGLLETKDGLKWVISKQLFSRWESFRYMLEDGGGKIKLDLKISHSVFKLIHQYLTTNTIEEIQDFEEAFSFSQLVECYGYDDDENQEALSDACKKTLKEKLSTLLDNAKEHAFQIYAIAYFLKDDALMKSALSFFDYSEIDEITKRDSYLRYIVPCPLIITKFRFSLAMIDAEKKKKIKEAAHLTKCD